MTLAVGQVLGIIWIAFAFGMTVGWWCRGGKQTYDRGVRRTTIEDERRKRETTLSSQGVPWIEVWRG